MGRSLSSRLFLTTAVLTMAVGAASLGRARPTQAAPAAPVAQAAPAAPTPAPAAPPAAEVTVAPGAPAAIPEPAIPGTGAEADYLRTMHRTIHWRWAEQFIEVAKKRPARDPLNNPNLQADIIFTVRWDGSPAQVTVAESSGNAEFDRAAVDAIRGHGGARYPVPPIDTYGDDGITHLRWVFARDHRLCSGGEVRRFEAPLKDALPRLFVQGRTKEALLRVARQARAGDAGAVSEFARAYLARRFTDPAQELRAAAALARAGDQRQVTRLKPALLRPDSTAIAAAALGALKVDLCPLVQPLLVADNPDGVQLATRALLIAGVELPADSPCLATLSAFAKEAPAPVRATALETLVVVGPTGLRRLALNALEDSDARVRAAGVYAFARPGGGRPTLYRLQPLMNDPSVEVRAAVAGGLVRACGDLANEYLTPFFKARDVQPLAAMAGELGKASSPASAELLGKLLKRGEPALRLPLFMALAQRKDAAGKALFQPLAQAVKKDPYATPEVRRIVYAPATANELLPLAKDRVIGIMAYKALLRENRTAEAVDWIISVFDLSPPEVLIEAFDAWLTRVPGPPPAAAKK